MSVACVVEDHPASTGTVVPELFGTDRCHDTQFYKAALDVRGVRYVYHNVDTDVHASDVLRKLYTPEALLFPTVVIGHKRLWAPSLSILDQTLERNGVVPMKLYHCPHQKRYFMYLREGEAYISYRDHDGIRNLYYSFVPPEYRGQGLGKTLAIHTLTRLCKDDQKTRFSCTFVRSIAQRTRFEAVARLQNQNQNQNPNHNLGPDVQPLAHKYKECI
ncbi:MAG: hypothetical protein COA69_11350 [Robiginitomaculum sp.]|nr:MAG: hypothetical protein COA69_11350 [Robiginitomaculum sp.]